MTLKEHLNVHMHNNIYTHQPKIVTLKNLICGGKKKNETFDSQKKITLTIYTRPASVQCMLLDSHAELFQNL